MFFSNPHYIIDLNLFYCFFSAWHSLHQFMSCCFKRRRSTSCGFLWGIVYTCTYIVYTTIYLCIFVYSTQLESRCAILLASHLHQFLPKDSPVSLLGSLSKYSIFPSTNQFLKINNNGNLWTNFNFFCVSIFRVFQLRKLVKPREPWAQDVVSRLCAVLIESDEAIIDRKQFLSVKGYFEPSFL